MPRGTPAVQPSQRDSWETPPDLFDEIWDEVAGFDFDPFCTPTQYTARRVLENGGTVCVPSAAFYTTSRWLQALPYAHPSHVLVDGLAQPWHGKVWMNSPYGLFLRKSVAKAVHEVECGNVELVLALVPSRTDVQWWQEHVLKEAAYDRIAAPPTLELVRFLKSRLRFVGTPDPATFPSAIVVWRR